MKYAFGLNTVSFNSNGGSHVVSQNILLGEKVTRPADPVKANYIFVGWFADNDTFNIKWNFDIAPDKELVLHAKWIEEEQSEYVLILDDSHLTNPKDSVSFSDSEIILETTALSGTVVTIYYTLDNFHDNNWLAFYINGNCKYETTTPGTGSYSYTVSSADADNGVITISAHSVHSDLNLLLPPDTVVFDKTGKISFNADSSNPANTIFKFTLFWNNTPVSGFIEQTITSGAIPANIVNTMLANTDDYHVEVWAETSTQGYEPKSGRVESNFLNVYFMTVIFNGNISGDTVTVNGTTREASFDYYYFGGDTVTLTANPGTGRYVTWSGDGVTDSTGNIRTITNTWGTTGVTATFSSYFDSIPAITAYLALQSGSSLSNPVTLPITIDLGSMTAAGSSWRELLVAINTSGKFVALDLSGCTMTGTTFNPAYNVSAGKNFITSIILPNAARSIVDGIDDPDGIYGGGGPAFMHFNNLEFAGGSNITSIGDYAFYQCTSLTNVDFPAAASIGERAFSYCTSLTDVDLPAAVSIGESAFSFCTSLTNVDFPVVENIGDEVFLLCTNLVSASFPAAASIGSRATFTLCTNLTFNLTGSGLLSVRENGKALVRNGTELIAYPSASGSINMSNITSIGITAFSGCTNLTSVNFPDTTSIGNSAFNGCTSLTDVNFPVAISIYVYAFGGCTSLVSVDLSAATSIGDQAFYNCTSLTSVKLGGSILEANFSYDAFLGNLQNVYFGASGGAGTYVTTSPGYMAVWVKE